MKHLIYILFPVLLSFVLHTSYPREYEKQINKEIIKLFGKNEFIKELLDVPDSLQNSSNNSLHSLKLNDSIIAFMAINKVNACKIGGCSKPDPLFAGRYDYFYYLIIFDTNYSILKVKVLDYQSDYGYEICSKSWLKQFIGQKGCKVSYGNEIDAISGATVSGNAIVTDIQMLCDLINKLSNLKIIK